MYFRGLTINHRDPNFRNFKWLIKTRDKNLPIMKHIYFDRQSWAATDGHRLHIFDVPSDTYEKGLYEIIAEKRFGIILEKTNQDITKYPKFEHLLDSKKIAQLPNIILGSHYIDINYTQLVRLLPENKTIQIKYFQDMMYLEIPWEVYLLEDEMTLFSFDDHVGIIMDMKM